MGLGSHSDLPPHCTTQDAFPPRPLPHRLAVPVRWTVVRTASGPAYRKRPLNISCINPVR